MKRIISIILMVLMIVGLTACGASPTSTTESFLNAVKSGDTDTINEVYAGGTLDIMDSVSDEGDDAEDETTDDSLDKVYDELLVPKLLDFDYEVSNEQIDGDKATVDVKFTTYKLGDAFSAFFSEYLTQAFALIFSDVSDEQMDALASNILTEKLNLCEEKTYDKTVTLSLSKKDGKWVVDAIEPASDIIDALSGGLVTTMKNLDTVWGE